MDVPGPSEKIWLDILRSDVTIPFRFTATRILVGRLRLSYRKDDAPEKVEQYIRELRGFFEGNQRLAFAKDDLEAIIQKCG